MALSVNNQNFHYCFPLLGVCSISAEVYILYSATVFRICMWFFLFFRVRTGAARFQNGATASRRTYTHCYAKRNLTESFADPLSEKIKFGVRMKPMFSALLFRELTTEIIRKSFYITVFTQGIVFSSQNKCFMVPHFDRMTFNICIIRKV